MESIKYVKTFYKSDDPLSFVIFHFGDLTQSDVDENGISLISIEKRDYPFFIHRTFMFDKLDEKVIFLDSDTICMTNIKKLFNIDLEGNVIGAAQHSLLKTHNYAYTLYKPTDSLKSMIVLDSFPFFNAGVMVVDCKKWKELKFTDKILELFELYRDQSYAWNDEFALNLLFGRTLTKFIDSRWNYNEGNVTPFIRHYYGHPK